MANGTIHKLGTLYTNNTKRAKPTNPWSSGGSSNGAPAAGNIFKYNSGGAGNIEIRNTDADDAYKLQWVEVNDGDKKLLICDRNILTDISWDDLNAQGLVNGKKITIDGQRYKVRLLSGGTNYRSGSDKYSGGTPTTNEWDRIITNESSFAGIPKPTSADLDSTLNSTDYNGAHNKIWNWFYCYSWCQEVYSGDLSYRVFRGYSSARYFNYNSSVNRSYGYGWRPALEVLDSAPTINGADGNLGDYASPLIKQYTISDSDNDKLSVTEKLDGATIKSLTNQNSGTSITLDLTSKWAGLSLGNHTVTITVDDGNGASATRTWTFNKIKAPITTIPITSSLKQAVAHNEEIKKEIQYQCGILKSNLENKGVEVGDTDKMSNLIDKVKEISAYDLIAEDTFLLAYSSNGADDSQSGKMFLQYIATTDFKSVRASAKLSNNISSANNTFFIKKNGILVKEIPFKGDTPVLYEFDILSVFKGDTLSLHYTQSTGYSRYADAKFSIDIVKK